MILLQLIGWCIVLGTTIFWSVRPEFKATDIVMFVIQMMPLLVIYLLNYFVIIPRLLFRDRLAGFFVANSVFIFVLLFVSYNINRESIFHLFGFHDVEIRPFRYSSVFLVRDVINCVTMVGLVTAVRLVERLRLNEEALRVAENARVTSELANLRSQINPHFLLNTLNNIYSLTVIDVEKAQKAIQELSRLLQYVLYDNVADKVALYKEVDFMKNYIELMRIRLNASVRLSVEINVGSDSATQIAPLIFISLIENAFKHGVGAGQESFITINFEDRVESGEVVLTITNSNNAKSDSDKSGSGIGLEQVRRRLDLQYPDRYRWTIDSDAKIYRSELTIKV